MSVVNKLSLLLHHRHAVRTPRFTLGSFRLDNSNNSCTQLPEVTVSVRTMASTEERNLNIENMNPHVKTMEYAVRGPLLIRAREIEKELEQGVSKPFDAVIRGNIGDAHAMGQIPITFIRQVLALCAYPVLLDDPSFPEDTKSRARELLQACRGCSVGSYSESPGIELIRRWCAEYIERRDCGIPSDWLNVVLSSGASDGIKNIIKLMVSEVCNKCPGIMIPIPQYPLYSATLAEFNVKQVRYYLDEEHQWGLDIKELERALKEAREEEINVKAIVVINPGNPTGQVLTRKNIEDIITFAYCEKLFVFADEVYQDNVYDPDSQFHSFKKVMTEMGEPYVSKLELASFMSCSKGYMGECGLRGGYTEVINMCPQVKAMYMKSISAMLCPTVLGQICLAVIAKPPSKDEVSNQQYCKEREKVLSSLEQRAKMVVDTFNSLEGFCCNTVQGAMYAFPQFSLPEKAVEAAKSKNMAPDAFYAFELLETAGICIIPGSGFGQKPGTYHFRTTILPQPESLKKMLDKFATFHKEFLNKYK